VPLEYVTAFALDRTHHAPKYMKNEGFLPGIKNAKENK
jgi:hypothetical protein